MKKKKALIIREAESFVKNILRRYNPTVEVDPDGGKIIAYVEDNGRIYYDDLHEAEKRFYERFRRGLFFYIEIVGDRRKVKT